MEQQPYTYKQTELSEPDWRRIPGWRHVTRVEWESAKWQRSHCIKSVRELRALFGSTIDDCFYEDLQRDQLERATMSMLTTPHMVNTMAPEAAVVRHGSNLTAAFYEDPVRRYMLPVFSDRHATMPSHPAASRDSLREKDMWVSEGLIHRYPTKVLLELLATCPQYCGHCTRMDLVGRSTAIANKRKLELSPAARIQKMLGYIRSNPSVRDVVLSGGDLANLPWHQIEQCLMHLLEMPNVRDIRISSKALVGLPQYWLQADLLNGIHRVGKIARQRGVSISIHTHANHINSLTPLVAAAVNSVLDAGIREVRNQGVLLEGVNSEASDLLDLCFGLIDAASITPYYFYMCDIIPFSEHWRIPLSRAQVLQHDILGYLPGYATPRIVCDVPLAGKRWVHQVSSYDREKGISYWTKAYATPLDGPDALTRHYVYFDPIHTLPEAGRAWWLTRTPYAKAMVASLCGGE